MDIIDIAPRAYVSQEQYKGRMDGLDLIVEQTVPSYEQRKLRIKLTKGEIGLIKFKTKNEENPIDGLLDWATNRGVAEELSSIVKAMDKTANLANIRPVTRSDMGRLADAAERLRSLQESLNYLLAKANDQRYLEPSTK